MADKVIQIGNAKVGKDCPTYLIGEIGVNHNSDMQIVKHLIDAVFACQWHAVKFQKRIPELCVPESQKNVPKDTPWGRMTYLEYKKRMELSMEDYAHIKKYCQEKPVDWGASVWDIPSLEFIASCAPAFLKIPSAKMVDLELVRLAAQYDTPLIISTGMSTEQEVDTTVDMLEKMGKQNYVLLYTVSVYPATYPMLNVRCVETMQKRYPCIIGYSGHESDLEPSVAAVALGAKVVERHITLDNELWGTDQKSSLPLLAMDMLGKRIAAVTACLGDGIKRVLPEEAACKAKLRG